mmetsp:Transcript_17782/g.39962  ORF Transcript_17782/g.39962 Transcript_17782/m.39962 type:complete len:214 (+) Transcript_17782:240-881(+)
MSMVTSKSSSGLWTPFFACSNSPQTRFLSSMMSSSFFRQVPWLLLFDSVSDSSWAMSAKASVAWFAQEVIASKRTFTSARVSSTPSVMLGKMLPTIMSLMELMCSISSGERPISPLLAASSSISCASKFATCELGSLVPFWTFACLCLGCKCVRSSLRRCIRDLLESGCGDGHELGSISCAEGKMANTRSEAANRATLCIIFPQLGLLQTGDW